jgi:glycerol-3-phosphate dehydrogenase (NAD(P)+)
LTTAYQNNPTQIAMIGGGSWATAIVKMLCENNVHIHWWMRSQTDIEHIIHYKHNPSYLSGVEITLEKVSPNHDLKKSIRNATIIILAVPAAFIADVLKKLSVDDLKNKIIVSAIKGMIPIDNALITNYIVKKFDISPHQLLVIAGPCHAEEVALEKQSYLTIGGQDIEKAQLFANLLKCRFIKASVVADIDGVEYCAVMKNIIALACGIAHGLGYGDNFHAVLVSNSMQEIKRFLDVVEPHLRDLNGSAYLGDLLVTTYSQFSRNRTFGSMIGRGYSVKSAQLEMKMIAEGYYAVKIIYEINKKYKVNMPITKAVYHILYEKTLPSEEFQILKDVLK